MNSNRYRLEGVRYANGVVSLQERPMPLTPSKNEQTTTQSPEGGVTPRTILNALAAAEGPNAYETWGVRGNLERG
jgi:hypothetical protein